MGATKKIQQSSDPNIIDFCNEIDLFLDSKSKQIERMDKSILFEPLKAQSLADFLRRDFLVRFFNVFYTPFYVFIQDLSLWAQGLTHFNFMYWFELLPPSLKVQQQLEIDTYILNMLFGEKYSEILQKLTETSQKVSPLDKASLEQLKANFIKVIEYEQLKMTKRRAERFEISVSLVTMTLGAFALKRNNWSLYQLGQDLASLLAFKNASSGFFLGETLGGAFYSLFPQSPSGWHLLLAYAIVLCASIALIQTVSLLFFLIRTKSLYYNNQTLLFLKDLRPNLISTTFFCLKP